jgi:hypothetical protein
MIKIRSPRQFALLATLGLMQIAGCTDGTSETANWQPSVRAVADLEATMTLPPGAKLITKYARYYTGEMEAGRPIILGILVLDDHRPAGTYIISETAMPLILDGGCTVITVKFDVHASQIESLACNGFA